MTLNLKWVNKLKFFRSSKPKKIRPMTVDRSWGYKGPGNPIVGRAKTYHDCQLIRMKKTGESAALIGPWVYNGRWDGSYTVVHADESIGYWFPNMFEWRGQTLGTAIELKKIAKQRKEKVMSKRNAAADV